MFGANRRVIEPAETLWVNWIWPASSCRTNECALQHAESATPKSRRVFSIDDFAAGLNTGHGNALVADERIKQADGVGAADTGDQAVGQLLLLLEDLAACLVADHALKVAHHDRVRMRPVGGARCSGCYAHWYPVAHGLVDGFLERLLSRINRHDGGAEHAHPEDVERLRLQSTAPM